jgi:hypothetical protein
MKQLADIALPDIENERVRRMHHEAIAELQRLPFAGARLAKADVVLADGAATAIPHGLGRRVYVWHSPPRGAAATGRIEELRDGSYDPSKYVVLKATGWGASIVVDVYVL